MNVSVFPDNIPPTKSSIVSSVCKSLVNATVPEESGKVIVLSAVGSVTASVVSKESLVAPSNVREAPPIVKFDICNVLNSTESDVPKFNEFLAVAPDSLTNVLPLPTMKLPSVGVKPDKACSSASYA